MLHGLWSTRPSTTIGWNVTNRHDTYTVRNFDHWQVFCTCGWNGPKRDSRFGVKGDHLGHYDDVRHHSTTKSGDTHDG